MARRATARLPGIRFETQAPPLGESFPRMDIAVFVGFAASGPIGIPVAVEDAAEFAAIFGTDAPIAWDVERGEQVSAYLAPAVRAFFRNGGRRCWIVRVAGKQARTNCFAVPGLARLHPKRGIAPAGLKARAKGSWSDTLRVGAVLLAEPLAVVGARFDPHTVVDLGVSPGRDLVPGDLVRTTFVDGYVWMFSVEAVSDADPVAADALPRFASPPRDGPARKVLGAQAGASVWFKVPDGLPATLMGRARFVAPDGRRRIATVTAGGEPGATWAPGRPVALDLEVPVDGMPPPGSLMRVDFGTEQLWLTVRDARVSEVQTSPPSGTMRILGDGLWWLRQPPDVTLDDATSAERLRFELRLRRGDAAPMRIGDLGFEPGHPRFWAGHANDQTFYGSPRAIRTDPGVDAFDTAAPARFPLSGFGTSPGFYFPIAMPFASDNFIGRTGFLTTALERDGLAQFDETLFLDPQLAPVGAEALMGEADYIAYVRPNPRRLSGIHAALAIEDATLVAVPDALQRGWTRVVEPAQASPAGPATQPTRPEWWHFLPCDPPRPISATLPASREEFLDCRLRIVVPPVFGPVAGPDAAGTLALTWSTREHERYTLVESVTPDFDGAVPIYQGAASRFVVYGRTPGDYFYWVRAEIDGHVSDWSAGQPVRVRRSTGWQLNPSSAYTDEVLLAVQRGLLRMAAARGDLLAVLTVPEHYRDTDAIEHVARLKASSRQPGHGTAVRPLGGGERRVLSYGALYHPWIMSREASGVGEVKREPPDGVATGILALRALERGAWIAPANEGLRGVVALTPPVPRSSYLALQGAQVNVIRHEPRGFVVLSSATLSEDADLEPISVRRLLILVRRLALREGAIYVFEPNDDAFRRLVQRGFEGLLGRLFEQGAFAGATPGTSFQVVTGSALNTSASVDRGRLIVELRVAPSLPLTFLTVRLVQSGDRRLLAEER